MPTTSDYTEGHTVRAFDAEMEGLRTLLLETGGLVADQVTKAVAALVERIAGQLGARQRAHDILFSSRILKKTGLRLGA